VTRPHHFHYQRRVTITPHEHVAELFPRIMELAHHDGNIARFSIDRSHETDDDVSFSADALHAMHEEIMVFVVSRVMRAWDRSSNAPRMLNVDVRVFVDDVPPQFRERA